MKTKSIFYVGEQKLLFLTLLQDFRTSRPSYFYLEVIRRGCCSNIPIPTLFSYLNEKVVKLS